MKRERIEEIIINAYNDYLKENEIEGEGTSDSILFGSDSEVDSMGFVNLIMGIESYFHGHGYRISLTDEEAVSGESSPFRTVTTLTDFILELIEEAPKQSWMHTRHNLGISQDVANVIDFFVSDRSARITGQTLYLCGVSQTSVEFLIERFRENPEKTTRSNQLNHFLPVTSDY